MSDFRLELNSDGIVELLHDDGLAEVVRQSAEEIKDRANSIYNGYGDGRDEGYEVSDRHDGRYRTKYNVKSASYEAYHSKLKHDTLLKAVIG